MFDITLAPLPELNKLLQAAINPALTDDSLAKPWLRESDVSFWFSRSAWSLQVIADLYIRINSKKNIRVWVPDFFCNVSLAPLRARGVKLIFYNVTNELTPDLEWCRSRSDEMHPDIFILVHYFGQPVPANQVAKFCKDAGAWLIEDAAHVLRPIPGVGENGDFVLYSPHKHLAIPDGAILLVRENGPSQLGRNSLALNELNNIRNKIVGRSNRTWKHSAIWLAKRVLQKAGIRGKNPKLPLWPDEIQGKIFLPPARMSTLAKCLLSVQISTLDYVAGLRKQHLKDWQEMLGVSKNDCELLKHRSISYTPYLACIVGKDFKATEIFYNSLQMSNLPVLTWPDLPPEVMTESELHKNALNLRKERFYLPVHQTLKLFQIKKYLCFLENRENGTNIKLKKFL